MLNTSSKKNNKPLKVGVTGGIGTGKSLICKIFNILNIPVFNADTEAKLIMTSDTDVRNSLISLLGTNIYHADGTLDRNVMAGAIFSNTSLLEKVNSIVHPAVRKKFNEWWHNQSAPYVIQEAAILFESGAYKIMDFNILIVSPEELRIKRLVLRDKTTEEQIRARMANQWPDEKKIPLANCVIYNNEKESLIRQVLSIHQKLLNYGKVC